MSPQPLPAASLSPCPHCRGATAIYNPLWRAYRDRYLPMQRAWEQEHPGQSWWTSPDYQQIRVHEPAAQEPKERPCATCDGHGVGDLIATSVAELAEAAERAWRHLATWRSGHGDLSDGRDALDALRLAEHEAVAAGEKLRAELSHAELTERLRAQTSASEASETDAPTDR
jgi:hypothetical protein